MTQRADTLFIGIRGTVLAIDRASGVTRWSTSLTGADFVNVAFQDGDLFASSKGRLYRLDPATGAIEWCNELPGLGWGLVSIAGASQVTAAAEKSAAILKAPLPLLRQRRKGGVRPSDPDLRSAIARGASARSRSRAAGP